MKTIYNRTLTSDELIEDANKRRQQLYRDSALCLCLAAGISPEEHCVGPYLHGQPCGSNLNATVRWLKTYLGEGDILYYNLDMEDCSAAFRTELHNKIPTNYWGDQA